MNYGYTVSSWIYRSLLSNRENLKEECCWVWIEILSEDHVSVIVNFAKRLVLFFLFVIVIIPLVSLLRKKNTNFIIGWVLLILKWIKTVFIASVRRKIFEDSSSSFNMLNMYDADYPWSRAVSVQVGNAFCEYKINNGTSYRRQTQIEWNIMREWQGTCQDGEHTRYENCAIIQVDTL